MAMHQRARRVGLTAAITAVAAAAGVTLLGTSLAGAAPAPALGTVHGADAATAVAGSHIVMLDRKADRTELAEEYGGMLRRNDTSANYGSVADLYAPGSDLISDWNDSDDATPEQVVAALTEGATPDAISNATQGTANKLLRIVE